MALLLSDHKLSYKPSRGLVKVFTVLERIDDILQHLNLPHEAVDLRLATVKVQLGYAQLFVGILGLGQLGRRTRNEFLAHFCSSQ